MLLKSKNLNCTTTKIYFFGDVDIRSILICSIITSDEKNYKYFIGYEDNDYKVKPLCIRLQRTSAYVKDYDGETKL